MARVKVSISTTSLTLIQAHQRSGHGFEGVRRLANGRYEIELDEEIRSALLVLDNDLDMAIAQLCAGIFGHA